MCVSHPAEREAKSLLLRLLLCCSLPRLQCAASSDGRRGAAAERRAGRKGRQALGEVLSNAQVLLCMFVRIDALEAERCHGD